MEFAAKSVHLKIYGLSYFYLGAHYGHDRMIVGFIATYAISVLSPLTL
jgi:hypothetical protein